MLSLSQGYLVLAWSLAAVLVLVSGASFAAEGRGSQAGPCWTTVHGSRVELHSPAFTFHLDLRQGLRALSLDNHLTGLRLKLEGSELETDLSACETRIEIGEWRWAAGGPHPERPDSDPGYRDGWWRPDFDDAGWQTVMVPPSNGWARTRFALPTAAAGKPVFLTVGGFGLFDFRFIRTFVNGREIATRRWGGRWSEPGVIELRPGTPEHRALVWAEDANVLALQLGDYVERTAALDAVDPTHGWSYNKHSRPPQFEQYVTVGKPFATPDLKVVGVDIRSQGESGEVCVALQTPDSALAATVVYTWRADEPVLHKTARIGNSGREPVRLMNLRLGTYGLDVTASDGEQGVPVYLGGQVFLTLAHPAGWVVGQGRRVALRQYPGQWLQPGESFTAMEALIGVAEGGQERQAFLAYLQPRMRRVVRGHDRPYATLESFGGQPDGNFFTRADYVLEHIAKVAEEQRETGLRFDRYGIEFWADYHGDLKGCDPQRFPQGLAPIRHELNKLGTSLSLWVDNTREDWSIGGNPEVADCYSGTPGFFCRACEPINRMHTEGLVHQIREYGVTQIKLDGQYAMCRNARHGHLPGVFSTEAIHNAMIEHLKALDTASPDVFLMLYWGFRSPWWLIHGDTLFEPGLWIEAASPGPTPRMYARDGVTVGLDQAQRWCADIPSLGKESLGIWLSNWPWNSSIGKERWQEGFVMDLCRGSLLAQPWTDTDWLTPPERRQMADFIALLRERPSCFINPRFVLGDPWRGEPYGYCCSDGQRAFVALNNCSWEDLRVPLQFNAAWGLPEGRDWDLYRWYPDPARLLTPAEAPAEVLLRPSEVVLLEVVPAGKMPSLERSFRSHRAATRFAEPSSRVDLSVGAETRTPSVGPQTAWTPAGPVGATAASGVKLTIQPDGSVLAAGPAPDYDSFTVVVEAKASKVSGLRLESLTHPSLPGGGPGWATNGNFQLSGIRVEAAPLQGGAAQPVQLAEASADFAQESYGGWPVSAALDDETTTAWSVDPEEGWPHAAALRFTQPVVFPGGVRLTITLTNGNRGHSLGRFRLSVTDDSGPLSPGLGFGRRLPVLTGRLVATRSGGTLVVTAEMTRDGRAFLVGDVEDRFSVSATVAGIETPAMRVVPSPSYLVPWQAWRVKVGPAGTPREFRVVLHRAQLPPGVILTHHAYFVPECP